MKRLLLAALGLLAPLGLAVAGTEDEDTQAPAASPTPFVSFGASGNGVGGNDRLARELADEPEIARGTFRWFFPIAGKKWKGGDAGDLRTTREGWLRSWAESTDGKRVELRVNADQRPLAFRTRIPFASSSLEDAGTHRESVRLGFSAPIPSRSGRIEIYGDWRGGGGVRPSTAAAYATGDAGPAFLAPAWREGSHGSAAVGATARGTLGGARVAIDGRFADESLTSTYRAPDLSPPGGLTMSRDERRRVGEAGVSVDVPAGALLAGGSYRFRASQVEGRGDRRQNTPGTNPGSSTLDDVDIRTASHRASIGVAFLPLPVVRTGVTATAFSQQVRAESSERRFLSDDTVSRGDVTLDSWSTAAAADATWFALSWLSVDARGAMEAGRYDDEWSQTLLAPDGSSVVGERSQLVTRDRSYSKVEGSVTAGPWRSVRATVGAIEETERLDVAADRVVDSPVFGDRSRDRQTVYLRLRARPKAGVSVDARAKSFAETRDLGETEPERTGSELRGRVSLAKDGASVFGVAALTDDRYELAALPPDAAGLDYLPIEFEGRSWILTGGVAAPFTKTWLLSMTGTRVIHAGDLDSKLLDLAIDVGGPLNDKLRLNAGLRRLDWEDARADWQDADAVVGFVVLSGAL